MSSRFRSLGPRDRRMNSQWPDFPSIWAQLEDEKYTLLRAIKEGAEKKRHIRRSDIPYRFLASESQYKQIIKKIKNLLRKDKAPSPWVGCPWMFW